MPKASRWLLALGICGSALAVGTVHTVTLCVVTVVLAAAAVLGWWGAEPMRARAPATVLILTGVGLTAYTALQCTPIPIGWLAAIAPHNAYMWSRALAPLREGSPAWAYISLDPPATRVEVLKGVAYVLAFISAIRIARRRNGVRFLSVVVVLTALALALAALLHPAFGATRLFGLYEPGPDIPSRHVAPFMNPNNLAGYLNVALCLSFAALLAPEPQLPRPIIGAVVVLLAATQIWVASRGGVISMVLAALIILVIARVTRVRDAGTVPTTALATGALLILGTALFVLSGSDEVSNELLDADVSKLKMFLASARGLPLMPLVGCGRGAFESVFPSFRTETGYVTFTHPENLLAQWMVEWGLPVAIAALVAVAFALRPHVVLARSATAGGAWTAIVVLAVQNLGDLGTEIPGLALAGVLCAAIVAAGTTGQQPRWKIEKWAGRSRTVAVCAALATAAAVAAAIAVLGRELHDDQRAMRLAATAHATSTIQIRELARETMLRHPAEPYLPFAVALRAAHEKDDDPIPWIGATFERARVYGPAHFLLARVVAPRSPSQARLEYRTAMEHERRSARRQWLLRCPRVAAGG